MDRVGQPRRGADRKGVRHGPGLGPGSLSRSRPNMFRVTATREEMLRLLRRLGIRDPQVLAAMSRVPREEFVPDGWRAAAYEDRALPIAKGQTISQPYVVARMTELLRVGPHDHVLEIGAGSGYQAAVLGELAGDVVTVELHEELADAARERLMRLG